VPDGWRAGDGLVLVQHDYTFAEPAPRPSLGPLVELQLGQGYAVAATSYRERGWVLFKAVQDNLELVDALTAAIGAPGEIYATGDGVGSLVAMKVGEDPGLASKVAGTLATCPIAAGDRLLDDWFDTRMVYDGLCYTFEGTYALPLGRAPTTWAFEPSRLEAALGTLESATVLERLPQIDGCFGLGTPQNQRTPEQAQRLAAFKRATRVSHEPSLIRKIGFATYGVSDIVRTVGKLSTNEFEPRNPFRPEASIYATLPHRVRIPSAVEDPLAHFDLMRVSGLRNRGSARVLALVASRDQLNVPEHLTELVEHYGAGRVANATHQATTEAHCAIDMRERKAGWNALREWTLGGPKPDTAALAARCAADTSTPGDCRQVPDLASRNAISASRHTSRPGFATSGICASFSRNGEGIVLEDPALLAPHGADGAGNRLLVSWFTYRAKREGPSEPLWLVGVADRIGEGVFVAEDMYQARGPTFSTLATTPVTRTRWGSLEFLDVNGSMTLRWQGPDGYVGAPIAYSCGSDYPTDSAAVVYLANFWRDTGTYTMPGRDGEGLVFFSRPWFSQVDQEMRSFVKFVWYTFDAFGKPIYFVGTRSADVPATQPIEVVATSAAYFGNDFDARAVQRTPWGRVTFESNGCGLTAISYDSPWFGFGQGRIPLQRLTDPARAAGISCTR